jgi:hypothetical protein
MYPAKSDDYFHADLEQRRREDERLTRRRWPGNPLAPPRSVDEALYLEQLAIALGEVDPRLLARESALRYVRASTVAGQDELGPTDIYAIFYYGLGLSLRPLDCTGLPHVLAVYYRLLHDVYLDWTLLPEPPYGRSTLDHFAWRRAIDSSPLARVLLSWCVATHLAENYDVPLVLGYSAYSDTAQGPDGVSTAVSPLPLSSDTFNRYRKTVMTLATLLAPAERLAAQIGSLGLPIRRGDPDWRVHLRAEYGFGSRRQENHFFGGRGQASGGVDPVEHVIGILAAQNQCPRLLVEWELDQNPGILDWDSWTIQLLSGFATLRLRYNAALQYFRSGSAGGTHYWTSPEQSAGVAPIAVRLAW